MTQLECIVNGATGIWASLCEEGASMGHCSSSITLMNLIRLGNKRVLEQYNSVALRQAAQNVTKITTGLEPHPKQPVYGRYGLRYTEFHSGQEGVQHGRVLRRKDIDEDGQVDWNEFALHLKWAIREYPHLLVCFS